VISNYLKVRGVREGGVKRLGDEVVEVVRGEWRRRVEWRETVGQMGYKQLEV